MQKNLKKTENQILKNCKKNTQTYIKAFANGNTSIQCKFLGEKPVWIGRERTDINIGAIH